MKPSTYCLRMGLGHWASRPIEQKLQPRIFRKTCSTVRLPQESSSSNPQITPEQTQGAFDINGGLYAIPEDESNLIDLHKLELDLINDTGIGM